MVNMTLGYRKPVVPRPVVTTTFIAANAYPTLTNRSFGPIDEEQYFILKLNGGAPPARVQAHVWCAIEGVGERVPVAMIEGSTPQLLRTQGPDNITAQDPQRFVSRSTARCSGAERPPARAATHSIHYYFNSLLGYSHI